MSDLNEAHVDLIERCQRELNLLRREDAEHLVKHGWRPACIAERLRDVILDRAGGGPSETTYDPELADVGCEAAEALAVAAASPTAGDPGRDELLSQGKELCGACGGVRSVGERCLHCAELGEPGTAYPATAGDPAPTSTESLNDSVLAAAAALPAKWRADSASVDDRWAALRAAAAPEMPLGRRDVGVTVSLVDLEALLVAYDALAAERPPTAGEP